MNFARTNKLIIASAFVFGMLTTVSYAHTPEQEQMCAGDAMRICSAEIPDVDRVTACMIRNKSQLSDGCKAVFRHEPATTAAPAPVSYKPASTKPSKPLNLAPRVR